MRTSQATLAGRADGEGNGRTFDLAQLAFSLPAATHWRVLAGPNIAAHRCGRRCRDWRAEW